MLAYLEVISIIVISVERQSEMYIGFENIKTVFTLRFFLIPVLSAAKASHTDTVGIDIL